MKKTTGKAVTITTNTQAGDAIVSQIEREFERQAPGFNRLPVDTRSKHVKRALSDVIAEIDSEERAKYEALDKIAGISPRDGEHEAMGFDVKGRLVHLRGLTINRITVKDSVSTMRKIELRWFNFDGAADWDQDDDARLRWFRMVEKALNGKGGRK